MSRRDRHGIAIGLGAGSAVVVPGAVAHVAAGGSLAIVPAASAVLAAAALATLAGRCRLRWTFPRLALAALAAQPLLHRVFAGGAHPRDHGQQDHRAHGAHAQVDHSLEVAAGSAHHGLWMALAHVGVAFGVAAGLRWGLRWLRSMPTLARSLALPPRGVVVLCAERVWLVARCPDSRPGHLATLAAHGSRGPPR